MFFKFNNKEKQTPLEIKIKSLLTTIDDFKTRVDTSKKDVRSEEYGNLLKEVKTYLNDINKLNTTYDSIDNTQMPKKYTTMKTQLEEAQKTISEIQPKEQTTRPQSPRSKL